jgi:transcriptional regulator with XRE-family HTH domain
MEELERIKKIMQLEQLNSAQFALEIGINGSSLSHILNGRNKPSLEVLKKILSRYPNISSDWLILGIGSISRSETKSQTPTLFEFKDESVSKSVDSGLFSDQNFASTHANIQPSEIPKPLELQTTANVGNSSEPIPPTLQSQLPSKSVRKIIVYYSDNTFQEFVG